ncbi:MAG: DUF3465 domain-containing protein [Pseudomonadota bacterium]
MRWRRRPSAKPENIRRRLANRVAQVVAALVIAGALYVWNTYFAPVDHAPRVQPETAPQTQQGSSGTATVDDVDTLYENRSSNRMVTVTAAVKRVLADDNDGSRHQRFVLDLPSGRTLLVAHNIDLAPRVPGIAAGDTVTVRGEYEWEQRGGVLHWTHHDPAGRHPGGWIEFRGRRYE